MEKPSRPVRNRKQSRRIWPTSDNAHRPVKRLFTPDIKKMLKEWLIRRRDNPYPNRDEKKALAHETGLTYTQICNWFANWRRKLKNSGREPIRRSWGNLIKNYNTSAKGNVEQFSISSSDSIWGEEENNANNYIDDDEDADSNYSSDSYVKEIERSNRKLIAYKVNNNYLDQNENESFYPTSYYFMNPNFQCKQDSNPGFGANDHTNSFNINKNEHFQEPNDCQIPSLLQSQRQQKRKPFSLNKKYKQQMMEKYLKDTKNYIHQATRVSQLSKSYSSSPELSKWLESAAKFTPSRNSYIEWNNSERITSEKKIFKHADEESETSFETCNEIHQKEELEAAEALTNLACNYRLKMLNVKDE